MSSLNLTFEDTNENQLLEPKLSDNEEIIFDTQNLDIKYLKYLLPTLGDYTLCKILE